SSADAALSLVPGDLTLSGAGDTGTIQVVSDADGGYGCLIELVDLTIADYDGDPTFTPEGNPNGDSHVHKFDAHVYDFIVSSINPGAPILAGVHINVNLIGIAEGVTTLNLYASDGVTLLDSATITVLPEPECFPPAHPDYAQWLAAGEPECWCNPRQCHGDADGQLGGSPKTGYYAVGPTDLNILVSAWLVLEPPQGIGIGSIPNGICADFAHDLGGCVKCSWYHVGPTDLNILISNWLVKEPPFGLGVPTNCLYVP
ncbi:MAG: hypothetical protein ACYSUY_20480, partial [Planctomycetota bacterium]